MSNPAVSINPGNLFKYGLYGFLALLLVLSLGPVLLDLAGFGSTDNGEEQISTSSTWGEFVKDLTLWEIAGFFALVFVVAVVLGFFLKGLRFAAFLGIILGFLMVLLLLLSAGSRAATNKKEDFTVNVMKGLTNWSAGKTWSGGDVVERSGRVVPSASGPVQMAVDTSGKVGVWLPEVAIGVGCSVRFANGINEWYDLQYRFYNPNWTDIVPGTFPNMSHFRVKLLRSGEERIPYTMRCS